MLKKMINKKNFYTFLIALSLFLVSFAGIAISEKEIIEDDSKDYTHTVLAEEPTATWCSYCPTVAGYMDNIWESYEYDWNFIALVNDKNPYAAQRNDELGVSGFPSVYYDGGYQVIVGSGTPQSGHESTIDACGARSVADIDIDLTAIWLGDNELDIDVDVTNNEGSTYDGNVRVYVTENYSRWYVYGEQYRFAFIGDYAFNEDVSISGGSHWNNQVTWDGDTYGFDDLESDNLRIIVAVFADGSGYCDESEGMEPLTNLAPTAEFSYLPEYPETMETITFSDESIDSDGTIVSWNWDFGDGSSSTNQNPSHEYLEKGYYTVSLTVEDDSGDEDTYETTITVTNPGEMVGASQANYDRPFLVRHASDGDWGGAQNFIPDTITTITKAELYMKTLGTPSFDLTVELREDSIDGTLLDTITMTAGDFSSNWDWIELNFSDVSVTPGMDYFIVLSPPPSGVTNTFGYGWGYALGDMYDDGSLWFTRTSGSFWLDLPDLYEFCFTVLGE